MANTQQYKCPSCGAAISFDPGSGRFKCAYCDGDYTPEQLSAIYPDGVFDKVESVHTDVNDAVTAAQTESFAQHNALYNCPSCGANIVTDETTAATSCYYCHGAVVLVGKLSGKYRPSSVIPFKFTEAQAKMKFTEFTKGKIFLPKGFRDAFLNEVTGIYVPYWLASCDTGGTVVFNCTRVHSWTSGRTQYTETKTYAVTRSANADFARIPHDASIKADDLLMDNLEPYNYSEIIDFDMRYLSGFFADKYDVDKESCYVKIRDRAVDGTIEIMRRDIGGYSTVKPMSVNVGIRTCTWEHMLFPVWFLAYKYGGKMYRFAMNGQTGKFAGNLPVSPKRVVAAVAAMTAVAVGLAVVAWFF
ncbi:hypothetical protein FACS1894133_2130 [Clostridia bacterium]|nr:hypothetical protein FACS1894133_2130 [Clostridia bacterium]